MKSELFDVVILQFKKVCEETVEAEFWYEAFHL